MAGQEAVSAARHRRDGRRRDGGHDLGPALLRQNRLGAARRPVGDTDRGPAARAPEPGRSVHLAHPAGLAPGHGRHPGPGHRRHRRDRTATGTPVGARRLSRRLAVRRALPGGHLGRDAVRRRRDRRTHGREQAQAFLARRRGRHGPVERHRAVGPPGRRRSHRPAALRRSGAGRVKDQPVRLAGRGRGGRAAPCTARVPDPRRRRRTEAAGRLSRPGGCPGRAAAGRRGGSELDGDRPCGHQPAQLPGHRPPHPVDIPLPAHVRRPGGGRTGQDPGHRGGLRMRAARSTPLAGGAAGAAGRGPRRWRSCSGGSR